MDAEDSGVDSETIEEQVAEWSSNSNECFTIHLEGHEETIKPAFTYPIFGEEESIFGYQGLAIKLCLQKVDLQPKLEVTWDEKFPSSAGVEPTDIKAALEDFLPECAFSELDSVEKNLPERPPGELTHSYTKDGAKYEVWVSDVNNSLAERTLANVQALVPMFIEGGTIVDVAGDKTQGARWKLHLLYECRGMPAPYSLIGFGTSYRIFTLPDRKDPLPEHMALLQSPDKLRQQLLSRGADVFPTLLNDSPHLESFLDTPSRERISQFLILPPYQGASHGSQLYHAMYNHLTTSPSVLELTVEDPNEAFDDLRDLSDLLRLRKTSPEFCALRVNTNIHSDHLKPTAHIPTHLIVPLDVRERIRKETKLQSRQFDRLVEMQTLSFIPPTHRSKARLTKKEHSTNELDKTYWFWRLYVKQRLYIFNRDVLIQVEGDERAKALDSAFESVVQGYSAMLERVLKAEERLKREGEEGDVDGGAAAEKRVRKRKVVEEDDDDGEDEEMGEGNAMAKTNGKKARIE
ncbi:histone acetyltransferase 1 [Oleoguttula sp. CCFEE 5521]